MEPVKPMSGEQRLSSLSEFKVRGVELHGHTMWRWDAIERLLGYMNEQGFNSLFLHQNDLLNRLVHFRKHYPPTLEDLHQKKKLNNIFYFRRIAQKARELGIQLFLEVKELEYEDQILQFHPEVYSAPGVVCPSHPFWEEFLAAKVDEVVENVPEIRGIVFTFSSPESRLWVAHSPGEDWEEHKPCRCDCQRCRELDRIEWYSQMLRSAYGPLVAAGKKMIVREFSYGPEEQHRIIQAIESLPDDVIVGIKNTPHDFWPTFPNNPAIGRTGNHPQWIEFDAWGELHGWSVVPCYRLEEYADRLRYAAAQGAEGFWCRVDWEIISEAWVLDTLNEINLYGMARLGRNLVESPRQILADWLVERFGVASLSPLVDELCELLQGTLEVIKKALYVRGHVFSRHSLLPLSVKQAWWSMAGQDSLASWEPERASDLAFTPENLGRIFAEKDKALALARKLSAQAQELAMREDMPLRLRQTLVQAFEPLELYVQGFQRATRAVFWTEYLSKKAACTKEELALAQRYVEELKELAEQMRDYVDWQPNKPHYFYLFLDPTRPWQLAEDVVALLESCSSRRDGGQQ